MSASKSKILQLTSLGLFNEEIFFVPSESITTPRELVLPCEKKSYPLKSSSHFFPLLKRSVFPLKILNHLD